MGSAVAALVVIGLVVWWVLYNPQTPIQQATSAKLLTLSSVEGSGQAQDNLPALPSSPPNPLPQTQTVTSQLATPQPSTQQPVADQSGNTITTVTDATGQAAATPVSPAKSTTKPTQGSPLSESAYDSLPAEASTKLPAPLAAPKPAEKRAPNNTLPVELSSTPSTAAPILTPKSGSVAGNAATNTPLAEMETSDQASNKPSLFVQRLEAGKQLLEQRKAAASIQLYYNEQINVGRIESFLVRAEGLGALTNIYLLPAKFGSKDGLRVLYGAYPSVDAARNAIHDLPKRYQDAFATSIYIF